ncbi:Hydroxymethylglutaryl-CoA lyase [Burkholderiales bacterium]|nr:Hydroxymethylglutaryl-CoA lyase [Burkholderiales bacterium]
MGAAMNTSKPTVARTAVRIVEVGPRDGLQNEPANLPLDAKRELIERLARAGLREIEAGAFVSPKHIPQMADSGPLLRLLRSEPERLAGVRLPVLTPNLQGYTAAVEAGADHVAVFAAASETFSQKNINCSIDESLRRFEPVLAAARAARIRVRGYLSCVVACPYEGAIAPATVAALAAELMNMGCSEISLGDTIGVGTPGTVLPMLEAVARLVPLKQLGGHFHDTYGMAVTNCYAAYEFGVRTFDASVAGLGGCPYAPGASGNVATEDLVYLFEGLGASTGVDLDALVECGSWVCAQLGRPSSSRVAASRIARRAGDAAA